MPQSLTPSDEIDQVAVVPWLYWSLQPVHWGLMHCYFSQIVVEGADNLPRWGSCILAPKHYSRWDPLVIGLLSREPLWFMTNASQFSGLQGWFIRRLGAFPIEVNRPRPSSFRFAIEQLQAGKKLVVFPEGGIVQDQLLRRLKPGLARLVLQTEATASDPLKIPIVPIALKYFPDPKWRAKIVVSIGPPLYAANYQQADEKQTVMALTQALQTALLAELEPLSAEKP